MGAHFEALNKGVLVAASESIEIFFAISIFPELRWHDGGGAGEMGWPNVK